MIEKIISGICHKMLEGNCLQTLIRLIALIITKSVSAISLGLCKLFSYFDVVLCGFAKWCISRFSKVENKVIFLTFQGDYTCNPKYIAEEMIRQELAVPLIWDIRDPEFKGEYPLELRFVEHNKYSFYKELATAKIIIENTNIVERLGVYKRKNQVLIQTWHGSLGIKRLDGDVVMGYKWKRLAKKCQRRVDYLLSNSEFENEVFENAYWKGVPRLMTGHARNDIFFITDEERRKRIYNKVYTHLGIDREKKIFLFAPTHRDNHGERFEPIDYEEIKNALETKFGGQWQIVIRLHNRLRKASKKWLRGLPEYVSDATMFDDMQELLMCTEVGVTDYSSWIFDYVLSRKPGFIIELGLEEFKNARGFYYPIETTPFPIAKNSQELKERILAFNDEQYQKDVDQFLAERGCIEDGRASERIVAKLKEIMEL